MENSPLSPEDGADKPEIGKKKKKAEAIGAFIVEPKAEAAEKKEPEKPDGWWEKLTGKDEELAEAPLDELSEDEKQYVEREIVQAEQQSETELAATPEVGYDAEELAAEQAVGNFRHKIVEEGKTSDEALAETVDEIDAGMPPSEPPEIPPAEISPAAPAEFTGDEGYVPLHETSINTYSAPVINKPEATPVAQEQASNDVGMLLLGGIIGYLVGRRRGRIKTEKRLLPVQKKLEKQVLDLRQEIVAKEAQIRQVVHKKFRAEQPERLRETKLEARELHAAVPPERIGRVIVTAEADRAPKAQAIPERSKAKPLEVEKRIETLSRSELLQLSEQVIVEATTLRQIYESHLIGERGLRRLLVEHLRGGDVKRLLRRELVEHEIDFERDPIMRDRAKAAMQGGGAKALNAMLQKVDSLTTDEAKEELAIYKAREVHMVAQQAIANRRRQLLDVSLITVIAVLLAIVIMLFLTN